MEYDNLVNTLHRQYYHICMTIQFCTRNNKINMAEKMCKVPQSGVQKIIYIVGKFLFFRCRRYFPDTFFQTRQRGVEEKSGTIIVQKLHFMFIYIQKPTLFPLSLTIFKNNFFNKKKERSQVIFYFIYSTVLYCTRKS